MFSFSVAFDPNKGIGIKGVIPWHIKEQLQLFKKNTLNKNILMGQTTYDKLPGKLKDRNGTFNFSLPTFKKCSREELLQDMIVYLKTLNNPKTKWEKMI